MKHYFSDVATFDAVRPIAQVAVGDVLVLNGTEYAVIRHYRTNERFNGSTPAVEIDGVSKKNGEPRKLDHTDLKKMAFGVDHQHNTGRKYVRRSLEQRAEDAKIEYENCKKALKAAAKAAAKAAKAAQKEAAKAAKEA